MWNCVKLIFPSQEKKKICFEKACVFCSDTAKYSSRQWSLNTQDLCFCGRVGECQVHSCLFDHSGRWLLGTEWRMFFVCDILEHLKEMIGQSAINRRRQSFIPNSLRGCRGKTTRSKLTGGRDGLRGCFCSGQTVFRWREEPLQLLLLCYFRIVIIQLIAHGS